MNLRDFSALELLRQRFRSRIFVAHQYSLASMIVITRSVTAGLAGSGE